MIIYNTKYLIQGILNSEIDDTRHDLNPAGDKDAGNSFKKHITNDDEFLQTILNNADTSEGIEDIKPMNVAIYLFEDNETYDGLYSLVKLNIVILQDGNLFSHRYNYLGNLIS